MVLAVVMVLLLPLLLLLLLPLLTTVVARCGVIGATPTNTLRHTYEVHYILRLFSPFPCSSTSLPLHPHPPNV